MNIIWKDSPNKDSNRKPIDRIVMHWFGIGTLEGANNRFQSDDSNVSAHYGISNRTIYQWVRENEVAYHAGNYAMNQRSIGIEHDATTEHEASEDTYRTAGELVRDICKRNNIPIDREHIIKHNEIVATQCPGTLDLDRIIKIAKEGDDAGIKLAEDIPTFVEDKYDLKSKEWYSKYWTGDEFIRASIKAHDELEILEGRYEDLQKLDESSRTVIGNQIEEIKGKNTQIETLQGLNTELTAQLTLAGTQVKTAIAERKIAVDALQPLMDTLKETQDKLYDANTEITDLNAKLELSLRGYTKWELLRAYLGAYPKKY